MGNDRDYVYLPLQDAISAVNQRVNLFAVVMEYSVPAKSKGSDYFCTLKIKDESFQQCSMPITFFAQDARHLPSVKSIGDIIRLHRVMIRINNGVAFAWYHKKISSFVLIGRNGEKHFTPYQFSSRFHITDHDRVFIANLTRWYESYPFGSGDANDSKEGLNESPQLKDIKEGHYFDLTCKVLHMHQVSEARVLLFVWDGTDAPPNCFELQTNLGSDSFPLHVEPVPLSRDTLCTFPCIGTVLRIVAENPSKDMLMQLNVIGHWTQLTNITCTQKLGLWEGRMMPSSRVFLLSDQDCIAQHRQRNYEERLLHEVEHMSLWSFPAPAPITETQLDTVGLSTLMEVLTHPKFCLCMTYVTYKYKCIVRMISSYPWRAQDLRSPIEPHVYRIRFILEDSTARVHAYLYAEDGEVFFEGYPPMEVLTSRMNKLLGVGEIPGKRNPPWVEVCIKSYYLKKADPWGTRCFRICNTKLVE